MIVKKIIKKVKKITKNFSPRAKVSSCKKKTIVQKCPFVHIRLLLNFEASNTVVSEKKRRNSSMVAFVCIFFNKQLYTLHIFIYYKTIIVFYTFELNFVFCWGSLNYYSSYKLHILLLELNIWTKKFKYFFKNGTSNKCTVLFKHKTFYLKILFL